MINDDGTFSKYFIFLIFPVKLVIVMNVYSIIDVLE